MQYNYKTCQICKLRAARTPGQKRPFLARFPLDEERCKKWVIATGEQDLAYTPIEKLHQLRSVCGKHFTDKDFKRKRTQLKSTAVPSRHLTKPPLDEATLDFFPIRLRPRQEPSRGVLNLPHDHMYYTKSCRSPRAQIFGPRRYNGTLCLTKNLPHDHMHYTKACRDRIFGDDNIFEEKLSGDLIKEKRRIRDDNSTHDIDFPVDEDSRQSHGDLDDNDFNCTEVEYLEEADSDGSDDTADVKRENHTRLKKPDTEDPTIMFDQDFKLTLDDVDFLFLSYARTFRSLAKQFQTMLKLDIAKLFARYEMKNNMNTEEGSKREEPPSEPVKPSPVEIDPPPAVTPPESVVKPPQFVVKPTQYVVKPSQFTHQTAVGPTQPVVQPSPDKVANFIPAKEANKKIFRRVPLQSVMSGVIAKTITSSPQAILVPQVKQAEPKETVNTPQVILVPPSRQAASQQTELPQITQTNELEKNTAKTYIRVGSVPKQFDPTVNIERLKTDASMLSSQSESLQPPAPKVMKYFVPKKGPAYAIFSKDSVSLQQETLDPDLDMEVTGRVRTETVFVPTDHVGYCEEEEAGDSSDSSS